MLSIEFTQKFVVFSSTEVKMFIICMVLNNLILLDLVP